MSSSPPTEEDRFLTAAENGNIDVVKELFSRDAKFAYIKDPDGYTPLHRAAYNNHLAVVKYLVKIGTPLESKTLDGWTPLHSACKWNNYKIIVFLIETGADVNAKTNSLQTPLHLAALSPNGRETLQVLLMNPRVDPYVKNSTGETAKQLAIRSGPFGYMFETIDPIFNPFDLSG